MVNQMINYMSIIIASLITFPFIPTWLVYKVGNKIVQQRWRALHIAINWTTILYIFATMIMLNIIFEQQFIGIILGIILLILAIILVWQWKTKTEVIFSKAIKILWRLCFLIFLFTYCLLMFYGIIVRIIS